MSFGSLYKSLRRLGSRATKKARRLVSGDPNKFLRSCSGVIHVGANVGQERETYAKNNLKVVWIEPIPEIYNDLIRNINEYPDQIAIQSLITDRDGETCTLHISSNAGESSSLLDLHHHRDIWPTIHYVKDIKLKSAKLTTALRCAGIDSDDYNALVIDTQGTELLVLKGAEEILPRLKYIKTEAADFESYRDCTTVKEIHSYLDQQGFRIIRQDKFAQRNTGGAYFDLLFERNPYR